jgi:hypothetical protein
MVMQSFNDEYDSSEVIPTIVPSNGKAKAQPTPPPTVSSAPSQHPKPKTSGLDRTQYANPNLQKPVAERQDSKQTIVKIRRHGGKFFRVHPNPMTRLMGVTSIVTSGGAVKLLTGGVSAETRSALQARRVLKEVNLYLACDEEGSYFIQYFSASDNENAESWVESGEIVIQAAEREWITCEAVMSEGGYRIAFAKTKYPKLAASKPKWELPGEDDPVQLFEQVIVQNTIDSDSSATIKRLLASRQ